jgi:hypothetical protein
MLTYLRYTLAAVCFAASVGCLALWLSKAYVDCCLSAFACSVECEVNSGSAFVVAYDEPHNWRLTSLMTSPAAWWEDFYGEGRLFGWGSFLDYYPSIYFPLWYPALIFTLAGIAALRFRRQFSIRSALVVVSVVAALLGAAVVL